MEIRRYQDIVAFQVPGETPIAFHAKNMEIAEISPEAFAEMTPIHLRTGLIPELKHQPNQIENVEGLKALAYWNSENNPEAKDAPLSFGIRSLTINVNQICNLKCHYCAAGGDGTYGEPTNKLDIEKTLPQMKFFLDQIKPHRKFSVTFVGGEPLLHPEAIKAVHDYIFAEATQRQIIPNLTIVTNGTLIHGKALDLLRQMKIYLTISLDGPKEINDIVRPSKDGRSSTEQIEKGLRALAEDRGQILQIGLSAVSSSRNSETLQTYRYLRSWNPDWIELNIDYAEKDEAFQKKYLEQMALVLAEAWARGGEKEVRLIRAFDQTFRQLDNQQRIENHCGAGKTYLMVDAKNRLYTCPWDVGMKDEQVGANEQLDHQRLAKYQKPLIELNNCQTCWARYMCGGGCMHINRQNNGAKHSKDILFCERTRGLILSTLLYYKRARLEESL